MIKKIIYTTIFFGVFSSLVFAQSPTIDSLKNLITTSIPDSVRVKLYDDISWELLNYDSDQSKLYIDKYLQLAKQLGHEDRDYLYYSRVAQVLFSKSKLDSSLFYFNELLNTPFLSSNSRINIKRKESIKNNIGNIWNSMGKYDSARVIFLELLEIAKEENDTFKIIRGEINVSATCLNEGLIDSSASLLIDAYRLSEVSTSKPHLLTVLVNLCGLFGDYDNCGDGKEYCLKAIELSKGNSLRHYATANNNLANCYIKEGELELARKHINEALKSKNSPSQNYHSYLYMAEILENKEKIDSSLYFYDRALKSIKGLGYLFEEAVALSGMAKYYVKEKSFHKAIKYGGEAIKLYKNINAKNIQYLHTIKDYFLSKSSIREPIELDIYEDFVFIIDSIRTVENQNKFIELNEKYKSEKKQIENERLLAQQKLREATISKQNTLLWGGGLGLGLLGLLSFLLFRQSSRRKEANLVLSKQRDQIKLLNREISHRVKNNLAFMTSLLEMQGRRTDTKEAKQVLKESESRLKALSLVHSNLFKNEQDTEINLRTYLEEILNHLHDIFELPNKSLAMDYNFIDYTIDAEDAMRIGLIINELVTNSVKYAFVDVDNPAINLETKLDEGKLVLRYRDNGPGIKEEILANPSSKSTSMGRKLIELLIRQLNAEMNNEGNRATIQFA